MAGDCADADRLMSLVGAQRWGARARVKMQERQTVGDVLKMEIDEAVDFFASMPTSAAAAQGRGARATSRTERAAPRGLGGKKVSVVQRQTHPRLNPVEVVAPRRDRASKREAAVRGRQLLFRFVRHLPSVCSRSTRSLVRRAGVSQT